MPEGERHKPGEIRPMAGARALPPFFGQEAFDWSRLGSVDPAGATSTDARRFDNVLVQRRMSGGRARLRSRNADADPSTVYVPPPRS
jgi:hypothetical protein